MAAAGAAKAAARPAPKAGPKRGPGRPPKKQPAPPLDKNGIVEAPDDVDNRFELVYEDPMMLKSLFAFFKNIKSPDIHIRCRPEGVTFFARDTARTCRVVGNLPGESMNHYYCGKTFWMGLNRESVERIFSGIDRSFFKVTLLCREDDTEELCIIFKDAELEKECHYRVTLSTLERDEDLYAAEQMTTEEAQRESPIEFRLSSKQFKKSVSDAKHHSDTITFEKLGLLPLQLTYNRVGIAYREVYRSSEKIGLRSAVEDGTTFRCTAAISNIHSLASAMVTDDVRIFCRAEGDLHFRSEISALVMDTFANVD